MAGLSGVLNIGYHGTSPSNLRSIATSGFTGGTGQSSKLLGMNMPSWGGTGKVYTAPNINVASTYGPRQIPVVQSAKHLKVPGGGIPGQTLTEAFKNIGKTKIGFETALKPGQATKGMNLYNKLMSGAYASSPTAKRLLETGTTAIKNPTNWAKVLGVPLSSLTGILSSTPANADEINMTVEDFQNLALQNQTQPIDPTGKNLFTEYYEDDPYAGIEGQTAYFNPLSLLTFGSKMLGPAHAYKTGGINELMKYKIRKEISKDVAKKGKKAAQKILEAKAAAKAKAEAEARKKQQQKTIAAKGTAQGSGGTFVHSSGAMKGYEKGAGGGKDAPSEHFYIARGGLAQRAPRYANGGLINFYRYGGFI